MSEQDLLPHLFRTEYSKMVSVLCKIYGLSNIKLAEDVVSETFLKASETWGLKGLPNNPTAWLYTVAKNRVKDHIKRQSIYQTKVVPAIINRTKINHEIEFNESNLNDSLLQMLFAICDPILNRESQLTFALRVLCGFNIDEIANALLSTKPTINKRLLRAKKKLRDSKIELKEIPSNQMSERLDNVLAILYLLFNEGYFSTVNSIKIRKDLCYEAMRLLYVLIQNKKTNTPKTNALMALFCFHTSRFEARTNQEEEQILFENQEIEKWNVDLIAKGQFYLEQSQLQKTNSKYHIEAMIAFWHTRTGDQKKRKWEAILHLYNNLLKIEYSPIIALNRTYALSKVQGKQIAIQEALKINLSDNHLYHALLADFYVDDSPHLHIQHLEQALKLAKSDSDKIMLKKKLKNSARH